MARLVTRPGSFTRIDAGTCLTPAAAGVGLLGLLAGLFLAVLPAHSAEPADSRGTAHAAHDHARKAEDRASKSATEPEDNRFQAHTHRAEPLSEQAYKNAPADVVLWGDLARALVVRKGSTYQTTFLPPVLALHGKTISIIGYVTPVLGKNKPGKQFLLSSHSFLCDECEPPAATELVEVNTRNLVIAKDGIATVRGQFEVVHNDPKGLAYRLNKAVVLKQQTR